MYVPREMTEEFSRDCPRLDEGVVRRNIRFFDEAIRKWLAADLPHAELLQASELFRDRVTGKIPGSEGMFGEIHPSMNLDDEVDLYWRRGIYMEMAAEDIEEGDFPKLGETESEYRLAAYHRWMKKELRWIDPDYDPGYRAPEVLARHERLIQWMKDVREGRDTSTPEPPSDFEDFTP